MKIQEVEDQLNRDELDFFIKVCLLAARLKSTPKFSNNHVWVRRLTRNTFLLQGNISLEKSARRRPFDWLPEQGWEDIIKLTTVMPSIFGSLADDVERNERTWKEVCRTESSVCD